MGSGGFMFLCQMVFFTKMAFLITITISTSFVFSIAFYMAQLTLIGPQGNFGNVKECLRCCFKSMAQARPIRPMEWFPPTEESSVRPSLSADLKANNAAVV